MPLDPANAPQTVYQAYTAYAWDYGVEGLPVAGPPGTPMEVIDEHSPVCYKIVSFVCQSWGDKPAPPAPDPGPNEVLKHKALSKPFPGEAADGTQIWTVAGVYVYLLLVPPSDDDVLSFGVAPFDASLQNVLLPSDFIKGILQNQATPTGSGAYGGLLGSAITKPLI